MLQNKCEPRHLKDFRMLSLALAVAASAVFCGLAQAESGKRKLSLSPTEKATGDFLEPKHITVTSDGKHIIFVFDTGQDIKQFLGRGYAHTIVEVYFDTDLNRATGGKPWGSNIGGFDFRSYIFACIAHAGGHVCDGGIGKAIITKYFSDYTSDFWNSAEESFDGNYPLRWEGGRGKIDGQKITTKIPYAEIKGNSGQTVRININPADPQSSKYPEALLTLK